VSHGELGHFLERCLRHQLMVLSGGRWLSLAVHTPARRDDAEPERDDGHPPHGATPGALTRSTSPSGGVGTTHELSRADARRVAVRAQLLDAERPAGLLDVVRRLTLLQIDPTAAIAPSADLVGLEPARLVVLAGRPDAALEARTLLELRAMVRPPRTWPSTAPDMAAWAGDGPAPGRRPSQHAWVAPTTPAAATSSTGSAPAGRCRRASCRTPAPSRGVERVDQRAQRHPAAGAHGPPRRGRRRRPAGPRAAVGPGGAGVPRRPGAAGRRGAPRARPAAPGGARHRAGAGSGAAGRADGRRRGGRAGRGRRRQGPWRVDPAYLGQPFTGRAALLSPFDRLVHDRRRTVDLFEFDYQLEMYKPAAKRRWGYFALPVLFGDRLVGKLDAEADRRAGVLSVRAVHEDAPFTKAMTAAVRREIEDLARWLGLESGDAR
jgi:hypothetical protein